MIFSFFLFFFVCFFYIQSKIIFILFFFLRKAKGDDSSFGVAATSRTFGAREVEENTSKIIMLQETVLG